MERLTFQLLYIVLAIVTGEVPVLPATSGWIEIPVGDLVNGLHVAHWFYNGEFGQIKIMIVR